MERKWTSRWYKPGDEWEILGLRNRVYITNNLERANMATWRWQFRENPAGQGIMRLAVDGDRIVGQYAVTPMQICVNGQEMPAGFSCDTMVDPDYQKQGIFTALARDVYARAEEMGISLVWGFPNNNSLPGFTSKLQWKHVGDLPSWVRPMRSIPVMRYVLKNGFLGAVAGALGAPFFKAKFPAPKEQDSSSGDLKIERMARADGSFDELWERNKSKYRVIQVRNAKYLNWRYFGQEADMYELSALRKYNRLIGYAVVRHREVLDMNTGVIAELFPADLPMDEMKFLVDHALRRGYEKGCALMTLLCAPLDDEKYKELGFMQIPERFAPKEFHFGTRCETNQEIRREAGALSNWFLTHGDTDLI